jgi:hypothetical protein
MPRAGANAVLSTTATFKLSLHPSAVADRNTSLRGARDLLDGMLMRHHDRLGGVLVSYDKPKAREPRGSKNRAHGRVRGRLRARQGEGVYA